MYHRSYTTYLQKELDFLKLLVTRFHEQEKVNGLELDIALLKTQDIYEQLLRIKLIPEDEKNAAPVLAEVSPIAEPERKTPGPAPQPEPPKKEQPRPQPVNIELEPVAVEPPVEVPVPEKVVTVKEEPAPVREEKKHPPVVEPAKAGILAEKIGPIDFHPINETLAQQKPGSDLSSKLQTAPLSSIGAGIGLNDKFLYIRELFKGDSALYSNTVRCLDTAESLGDAMDFINRHFDWDKKNETTQKFINLVQRRHGN
ncbi:MAG: hypothetical protein LBL24_03610 [Bacteroidales bacterium]|jgi:hypothetical protein|nr:hypothetical protein [Bacteroidales bacterium]